MEIGSHVMQRYVKRVLEIDDGVKARQYAENNKYEVIYNILKLFNESTLLIKDYAPTRRETLDYYINSEILIIVNPRKNEISTLYYVTLEEDNESNREKVKEYVRTIKDNNNKIKKINIAQAKQDPITKHLEFMIERLVKEDVPDSLIKSLQEETNKSIEKCKDFARDAKALRMENRELMTQLFRKLKSQE
jgi:signal recognition particle GTPase